MFLSCKSSYLMHVVSFRCVSTWLELTVSFVKSDFSAVCNQSWPRCVFPSAWPRLKAVAEGGQQGSRSGWVKTFVCIKTIWKPFVWKDVAPAQFWATAGNLTEGALNMRDAVPPVLWKLGYWIPQHQQMLSCISLFSFSHRTGQSSRGKHRSLTWREERVRARQKSSKEWLKGG